MRPGSPAFFLCAIALFGAGCDLDNEGDKPPRGELYFPNAMALSAEFLWVANSNFDLRYNGGSAQAYSRERLAMAADVCREMEDCTINPRDVLADEVLIGSESTSIAVTADERQLFVTANTDSRLSYVDLTRQGDALEMTCGGGGTRCESNTDLLPDPTGDGSKLDWPRDPIAVISGPLSDFAADGVDVAGNYAIVAHRGSVVLGDRGAVSLFVEDASGDGPPTFTLVDVLDGLEPGLTQLAYDPDSQLVHVGVARASAGARVVGRVGVALSDGSALDATLFNAGTLLLEGATDNAETHDLVFSPQGLLIVSQAPSALLVVDLPETQAGAGLDRARVTHTVVVGGGASRVVAGTVEGRSLAVVACFDAREIFVIDLVTMHARSVVPNLSGPFELALDEERGLLYAADFRTSVIRIIDLLPLVTGSGDGTAKLIATMGEPKIVLELQ